MRTRPEIEKIQPYQPGKPIEELRRELGLEKIIKLASNENPLGPSPLALEALARGIGDVFLYPDGSAYELKERLSQALGVGSDQLIIGNGSDEVIKMLAEAFLLPGEEVLTATPTFGEYAYACHLMGGSLIEVPLKDYTHDLPAMAARLSPRTKLVFVCNPNNPTGTVVGARELKELLDALPSQAILVVDEAYFEYAEDPAYSQVLQWIKEEYPVVLLRTFSKIYGLAGLRVGYGVAPRSIIAQLHRVREPFNVNLLAQRAATAALDDQQHVGESRRINRLGMEQLTQGLERLGIRVIPSQANFLLCDLGLPTRPVFVSLLQRGIILRTGDVFGLPTHLRITIGRPQENEAVLAALSEVL